MRYYGFTNMYLSAVQVGVQNFHCVVDMGREYDDPELIKQGDLSCMDYVEWADNHKTVVYLNGGNQTSLIELCDFFDNAANSYAWGFFREDEESLNDCMTCVGIILPERIYETAKLLREDKTGLLQATIQPDFTEWEINLMQILPTFRLAN